MTKIGGMQNLPSRRSFIIAGGMTALAATRAMGANDTLRIGVIGAGGRMEDLLTAADKVGGYQIVAVSDVYEPRIDEVKKRPNASAATAHANYLDVLHQNIDAGFMLSPDYRTVKRASDSLG